MNPRNITIFRTYQTSSHKTLGFYSGEEDSVLRFCHLKYDIEVDDIALEAVPVRKVTRSEVVCFTEVMDQLNDQIEGMGTGRRVLRKKCVGNTSIEKMCEEDSL